MRIELGDEKGKPVISLTVVRSRSVAAMQRCEHWQVEVDTRLAELTCQDCKARLNPVEWIARLAERWHVVEQQHEFWNRARVQAEAIREALEKKARTRCQHCQRVTRVSLPRAPSLAVVEKRLANNPDGNSSSTPQ